MGSIGGHEKQKRASSRWFIPFHQNWRTPVAKYFTEINTLSEELIYFMKFSCHKFGLTSTKEQKICSLWRYEIHSEIEQIDWYEAAAYVNIHSEAMGQLIQVLAENPENNPIISAYVIQFAYLWFMQSGPTPLLGWRRKKNYFMEISNYFDAFQKITNDGWSDGKDRWLDSTSWNLMIRVDQVRWYSFLFVLGRFLYFYQNRQSDT